MHKTSKGMTYVLDEAMVDYIQLVEATRQWPSHSQWLMYFMIEKSGSEFVKIVRELRHKFFTGVG